MEKRYPLLVTGLAIDRFKQLVHGENPTDISLLFRATIGALGRIKIEYPSRKIFLVSGRVSADTQEHFEQNEERLRMIAYLLQANNSENIYITSAHIMPEIRSTIQQSKPSYNDFLDLWGGIVSYSIHDQYINGLVMTPGWEASKGCQREYTTALACGLTIMDYTGHDPAQESLFMAGDRRVFLG